MNFKKLYILALVAGLVWQATIPARAGDKDSVLTEETKQNAIKALATTAQELQQLNAPENRVRAATLVAGLLWEHDEREARVIFQNARGELQNLLAAINPPEGTEVTRNERAEQYVQRDALAVLRRELVLSLAERDPQAALDAFAALKIKTIGDYDPLIADELELQLTSAIARKDPEKAFATAKRQFDTNGLNYQFMQALKEMYKRDSRLAAKIAKDVLAKIKTSPIRVPLETDNTTVIAKPPEIGFWQLANFISTVSELNRMAARDKKMQPLYSSAEMKELVEAIAGAYLAARNPVSLSIGQVMSEITQFAPAMAQRIRVKGGATSAKQFDQYIETNTYFVALSEKSVEQLMADAERAPADRRDQQLSDAAYKALQESDAEKAQMVAARIKDRKNFEYLFEQIGAALPLSKARRGDPAEVRKILAGMKNNREKIAVLTELALALAAKGEKETAKSLLDEAMTLMPVYLKNYREVDSVVRIAAGYAVVDPDQAFSIIESGIAQSDEYINAGVKLDEFYVSRATEGNELLFTSINRQFLMNVPDATGLVKNLARADFERAIGLADKFQRPEIRLFIRLRVFEALFDPKATEKEKETREQLVNEDEA